MGDGSGIPSWMLDGWRDVISILLNNKISEGKDDFNDVLTKNLETKCEKKRKKRIRQFFKKWPT